MCSRRSPAGAARDRAADPGARRPAHRCAPSARARPPCRAPRPCRAGAGTRSPSRPARFAIMLDRRQRMRIVRRELRIDRRPRLQQRIGAGEIGDVRRLLGGEHRIVRLPVHLRALHFRVPVGALHQPHHQAPVGLASPDRRASRPPLRRASDRPAPQGPARSSPPASGSRASRSSSRQRQREPVRLFRIEREVDVLLRRQLRQLDHHRIKLAMHPLALHGAIGRMQRRQLHRNAVGSFRRRRPSSPCRLRRWRSHSSRNSGAHRPSCARPRPACRRSATPPRPSSHCAGRA